MGGIRELLGTFKQVLLVQRPLTEEFVTNAFLARLTAGRVGAQHGGLPCISPLNRNTKTTE